jgi:serralysin
VSFDALKYIASHDDLTQFLGADVDSAAAHFITRGATEGRVADFDAVQYLKNYGDLQLAFGGDLQAATIHFIQSGFYEHRTDDAIFMG